MHNDRYLTLEEIQRAHPKIAADMMADVQRCCQPSGTSPSGEVLYSEKLVTTAARVMQHGAQGRIIRR